MQENKRKKRIEGTRESNLRDPKKEGSVVSYLYC